MPELWGLAVALVGGLVLADAEGLVTRASNLWVSLTEPLRQRARTSPWGGVVSANRVVAFERTMMAWRVFGLLLVLAGIGVVLTSLGS